MLRTKDWGRADGAHDQPLPPGVHSQGRDRDQPSHKLPALTLTYPPSPVCEASLSLVQPCEPGAYAPSRCLWGWGHHPGSHLPATCNQLLYQCHTPPHPNPHRAPSGAPWAADSAEDPFASSRIWAAGGEAFSAFPALTGPPVTPRTAAPGCEPSGMWPPQLPQGHGRLSPWDGGRGPWAANAGQASSPLLEIPGVAGGRLESCPPPPLPGSLQLLHSQSPSSWWQVGHKAGGFSANPSPLQTVLPERSALSLLSPPSLLVSVQLGCFHPFPGLLLWLLPV